MKKTCCKRHISTESALDRQEQGSHYKNAKIQAIEFITAHKLDFIDGNIVKYAVRRKNGESCLLYTSPSPRDGLLSRMPSSA